MRTDRPIFAYSMFPVGKSSFKDFYDGRKLNELLENPGQFRPSGWDLVTHDRAKLVKGEYLQVKAGDRKLVRLYIDGTFLARVPGDEDFMSWGQNTDNFNKMPRLNSLALVEFTTNFILLSARIVQRLTPIPPEVMLQVELRNAMFGDRVLYLPAFAVSSNAWRLGGPAYKAPDHDMLVRHPELTEKLVSRPLVVAFEVIQKIYGWFGLPTNEIPYISEIEGVLSVDPNLIVHSTAY